jgi:hypothetical protein
MAIGVARNYPIRHNRLRRKGVSMQGERILKAAMYVARIRESSQRAHAYRIRAAKKLCDITEGFIAEEVRRATTISKNDPAHMSWNEVASALEITKSKAFRTYGGKPDEYRR